jgi:putative radical SAM enzyme (TIGR03279 family)
MTPNGIRILKVKKGSAAARANLVPGDRILEVGGHATDDELALRFYLAEERLKFRILKSNGSEKQVTLDLCGRTEIGLEVEEFKTRTCNNACLFCFVDQLPQGVRPGLKVKDDDYRLSFLHGNYVTLTNVSEKGLNRIIEQRLSPLYVSVHATETNLRTLILGRTKADDLNRKLKTLIGGGIQIHAQIVLLPGINDGEHLKKTVYDLYALHPGIQSVAIVPLGLSDHGKPRERLSPVTPDYCRRIIRSAIPWQNEFLAAIGRNFACLADEFYIQGGIKIPGREYYDDFSQTEDGIGMVRLFLDEFEEGMKRRRKSLPQLNGTLVTGKLFAPTLNRCITRFNRKFGSRLRVCEALNHFLGRDITVAGLLSGQDILAALNGSDPGQFVVIPNEAVSRAEGIMLDDLTPTELSARLRIPVYASGRTMPDFFTLMFERLR